MATKNYPTKEQLHQLFEYKDGELYWKKRNQNKAGSLRNDGRKHITINYKIYKLHRIIFLWHHGYLPKEIDHIDGNPLNNRIENLREATRYQNLMNKKKTKQNTSGCKNVSWNKSAKKWLVSMQVNGKRKYLGIYDDLELADLVATEARDKFHGNFANHL